MSRLGPETELEARASAESKSKPILFWALRLGLGSLEGSSRL